MQIYICNVAFRQSILQRLQMMEKQPQQWFAKVLNKAASLQKLLNDKHSKLWSENVATSSATPFTCLPFYRPVNL